MATLLEYAEKARIRTQRLQDYLAERGYGDIEPDHDLPEEALAVLEESFSSRQVSDGDEADQSLLKSLQAKALEQDEKENPQEEEQPEKTTDEATAEEDTSEMDLDALFSQLEPGGGEEDQSGADVPEVSEPPKAEESQPEKQEEKKEETPADPPEMDGDTLDLESLLSTLDVGNDDSPDQETPSSSKEPESKPESSVTGPKEEPDSEETVELEKLLMTLNAEQDEQEESSAEENPIMRTPEADAGTAEDGREESEGKLAAFMGLLAPMANSGESLKSAALNSYQYALGPLTRMQKILLSVLLLVVTFLTALAIVLTVFDFGAVEEGPLLEQARQSLLLGNEDKAAKQFLKIVNKFPNSPAAEEAWVTLADMFFEQKKYDEALTIYRRLIDYQNEKMKREGLLEYPLGSVRAKSEIRIAECLMGLNRFDDATQKLLVLQDRYPGGESGEKVQYLLVNNYLQWGRYADERGYFQLGAEEANLFLTQFPNSSYRPHILERRGDHYAEMARKEKIDEGVLYSEALASYKRAEEAYRNETPSAVVPLRVLVKEGDVQMKLAEYDKAEESYENVLASSRLLSGTPEVTIKLAKSLLKQDRATQAAKCLESLLGNYFLIESEEASAHYLLGDAYFGSKRYDLMQDAYSRAVRLERYLEDEDISPMRAHMRMTNFLYFNTEKYVEAIRQYESILEKYPQGKYRFRALYLIAEAYTRIDRLQEAAQYYKALIEENPRLVYVEPGCLKDSFFKLGKIYYKMNELPKAIRTYEALLEKYPKDKQVPRVLEKLGDCYADLQSLWVKAEETYQKVMDEYPDAPNWVVTGLKLGQVEENMGNLDAAQDVYLRIIRREPNDPLAPEAEYRRLEVELRKAATEPGVASERRYMSVLSDAQLLKKKYPQYPNFARQEGTAAYFLRDFRQAATSLENYVSRAGDLEDLPHSHFLLGDSFYRLQEYEAAADYLKRRVQQGGDPHEKANALFLLAQSQKHLNARTDALNTLNELIREHPSSSFIPEASAEKSRLIWERDNAEYLTGGAASG